MNKHKVSFVLLVLFAAGLLTTVSAGAADLAQLRERMRERIPTINELKQDGAVGENNQGYLEWLRDPGDLYDEEERVNEYEEKVEAENNDRRRVYSLIAASQGVEKTLVGERRASQIAASAVPGVWVQREDGEWVEVPEEE